MHILQSNKNSRPTYGDLRKQIPVIGEQFRDTTGTYLSGQCEWNCALGLKDIVH